MPRFSLRHAASRFLPDVTLWILLIGGMAIIGTALLVEPWLECRRLSREHDLMCAQVQDLQQQHRRYQYFYTGLTTEDPLLLNRLAYHCFRLKPAGTAIFETETDRISEILWGGSLLTNPFSDHRLWADEEPSAVQFSPTTQNVTPGAPPRVGALLGRGAPSFFWQPDTARWVRLATGPMRLVLVVAGVLFLIAAAMLSGYSED